MTGAWNTWSLVEQVGGGARAWQVTWRSRGLGGPAGRWQNRKCSSGLGIPQRPPCRSSSYLLLFRGSPSGRLSLQAPLSSQASFRGGTESRGIKKAERQRTDAFELWCWRRLLRVPWTARRSNQSILKEISPEYSLEGLMLKLKLQYFGHLM